MSAETADASIVFERDRDTQAWARWLGRLIDRVLLLPLAFGVFFAVGALVEIGRLPSEFIDWLDNPIKTAAAEIAVVFVLAALWEPLFLSNTGTTPGKWIMGVRIRRPDGSNISLFTAVRRFFWVYIAGLGLGIPLVSLICMLVARATLVSEGALSWDTNLGIEVTHAKRHPLVWLAAFILVFGINIGLGILNRAQT